MSRTPKVKAKNAGHAASKPKASSQPRKNAAEKKSKSGKGKTKGRGAAYKAALALRAKDPYLERERAAYSDPLPSREYILELLAAEGVPMTAEELAARLAITIEEEALFAKRLRAMERDAQVLINRKGAICIAEKLDLFPAKIQGHKDGFGFAILDDGSPDYFLEPREMKKVLHGDRVMVRASGVDYKGRPMGKIVEVLERKQHTLVAKLINEHGIWVAVPEDKRISQDVLVPDQARLGAQSNQVVMVQIMEQPNKYAQPIGKVVQILGDVGDSGMEIEIALRKHELPYEFSIEAQAQADETPKRVLKRDWQAVDGVERRDLRDLPLVTIDGETAKDFDDAVYAEPLAEGRGWRVVVAIADVSHYVQEGDALDVGALDRGNSVYFPRRVIPMLPEALSNGICSLKPKVERLCMVCDMQVSPSGKVGGYEFYPAVMKSQARLTYTQVAEVLTQKIAVEDFIEPKLVPHLQDLNAVFLALHAARQQRGAIEFESSETQLIFDKQGKIAKIIPVVRNDAHRLIEECMLATNVCAAEFLLKAKHPVLFRVHDHPSPEKLDNLRQFLRDFSLTLEGGDKPSAKDYAHLMSKIHGRPDASLMQTVLLRSMMQAVYSPDNAGHFGLAFDAYAHFTSPIRRYPDLLVHRAIKAVLAGKKYRPKQKWDALGVQCSHTERRADDASRDVMNWLKCYFMQDKIGQVYTGTVSATTGFGAFVLLDDVFIEGLIHVSELGNDYFVFDKVRHVLKGERTGQQYRLGDRVTVKVVRVDMNSSKIDFLPVIAPASAKPKRKKTI